MKRAVVNNVLIFIVLIGSVLLVSAQFAQNSPTTEEILKNPLSTFFGSLDGINLARYLYIILLTLFTYSILDLSGLVENQTVRWLMSFIVAFLSVFYLSGTEILITLQSYKAYGATVLIFIPILILFFFTLRMAFFGGAMGVIIQKIMWFVYFAFLLYGFFFGGILEEGVPAGLFWVSLLVVIAMMVLNSYILHWFSDSYLNVESDRAGNTIERAAKMTKLRAEELRDLGSGI